MQSLKNHPQFEIAKGICQKLANAGFKALLAGGCVRDGLMGIAPKDIDIASSATPDQVEPLFERTEPLGKQFGIMLVVEQGIGFEIATFRTDGEYSDGRHPEQVKYSSIEEDAARRDFTINALYFDCESEEVIDLVGGKKDLLAKKIRAVGDPIKRFSEDHLRMLRGIRFASRFEFTIDKPTFAAIEKLSENIDKISIERIQQEIELSLQSENWLMFLTLLDEAGLAKAVVPDWNIEKIVSSSTGLESMDFQQKWFWILLLSEIKPRSIASQWRFRKVQLNEWTSSINCFEKVKLASSPAEKLFHLSMVPRKYFDVFITTNFKKYIFANDISEENYAFATKCRAQPLVGGVEVGQYVSGAEISKVLDIILMQQISGALQSPRDVRKFLDKNFRDH